MLSSRLRHETQKRFFRAINTRSLSTTIYRKSEGALDIHASFLPSVISGASDRSERAQWRKEEQKAGQSSKTPPRRNDHGCDSAGNPGDPDGSTAEAELPAKLPVQFKSTDYSTIDEVKNGQNMSVNFAEERGEAPQRGGSLANPRLVEDAHREISQMLESSGTHDLLQAMWTRTQDAAVTASIPSATFVEILRQLDPCDDFLPFRSGYKERTPKHYAMLTRQSLKRSKELQRRRIMFWDLSHRRIQAGRNLNLMEYKQLLKCARGTWDGRTASSIMEDMMAKNIQPDLACYNYYFEARCWSDAWYPNERQRLRIIPFNQERRTRTSELRLREGITINPHMMGQDGLKAEMTRMFTQMIEAGTVADVKAYGHLVTALARDGDMQGVKAVLNRAWDVDVDAINNSTDVKKSAHLRQSSPLYPTQDLLFIIAHAFGSNNDVGTALQVVDHFSRRFSVPISQHVCAEMLEWAYVLSTPRSKKRKEDGAQLGQLPVQTVENLWNVLISEPYCCKPSLPMYDLMIRSLRRRDHLLPMLRYIFEAYEIHLGIAQQYHDHLLENGNAGSGGFVFVRDVDAQTMQQDSEELRHKVFTSFVSIHEWLSLLLAGQRFLSTEGRVSFWQRQLLPDVINIFWSFRDRDGIKYKTESGEVHLRGSREKWNYICDLEQDFLRQPLSEPVP